MFQRSEIGRYQKIEDRIKAMLNSVFITPLGNKYKLIRCEKKGKKRFYTYFCLEFPHTSITADHRMELGEIMDWIKTLK